MTFSQAVSSVLLNKYATFSGRARRSEYWWWYLFVTIVFLVASVIDRAIGFTYSDLTLGGGWLATIAAIVFLVPNLAVGVRRLHDTGRSGWWLLIGLVALDRCDRADLLLRPGQRERQPVRPVPQGLSVPSRSSGAPGRPPRGSSRVATVVG